MKKEGGIGGKREEDGGRREIGGRREGGRREGVGARREEEEGWEEGERRKKLKMGKSNKENMGEFLASKNILHSSV